MGIWQQLEWLAPKDEILWFLQAWAWVFAVLFVLRLFQRFGRWRRRRRALKAERRAARR